MIRVNPRQASLRAPEITSPPSLTPLGAGRDKAGAQSTPGQAKAAQRLPKDQLRTKGPAKNLCGLQLLLPQLLGGQSQRLLPKGRGFAPSHTSHLGARESPGTTMAPPQEPCSAPGHSALLTRS